MRGPPVLPLRLLAPLVVAATLAVFATGVALLAVGPGGGLLVGLHKASFVVWLAAAGLHVLAHVRRLLPSATPVPGGRLRLFLLGGTIAAGAVLAVATIRYAHPWVHWFSGQHEDG
jgi:hypothetical protein